jgi:hypothetical protein
MKKPRGLGREARQSGGVGVCGAYFRAPTIAATLARRAFR